jgi:hypothetical protein
LAFVPNPFPLAFASASAANLMDSSPVEIVIESAVTAVTLRIA